MNLRELVEVAAASGHLRAVTGEVDAVELAGLTHDSRSVGGGVVFCAVRGERADGHRFAAEAVAAGSPALVVDHQLDLDVAQLVVDDVRATMPLLAASLWGHPDRQLSLVGVTGTNGKTTVVTLCEQLWRHAGVSAGSIGTLTGVRTTPESTELVADLRARVDSGQRAVAMEVSSHALALHRVDGLVFGAAVFTNLGVDHLDFHGTMDRYFEAKARLFEDGRCQLAVINVDDPRGRELAARVNCPVVACSLDDLEPLTLGPAGAVFRWRGREVRLPLVGRFNVTNAVLAAEAVAALGLSPAQVVDGLARVVPPPGRLELVDVGQPFLVLVDYAHTPDALAVVLRTARELGGGSLRLVFGCGGDRDREKRPAMGAVATELADDVVITSDNPRSESPSAIMSAVLAGCVGGNPELIEDRREAIASVMGRAAAGDVVVIAGKGHETTQTIGDRSLPFDDRTVAAEVLADLRRRGAGS